MKEYIKELFLEAAAHRRRGVNLGNKLSILEKYKDDPYVLVHFSDLNKLGMNPKVSFDTPVGIYGYNLKILYDDIINNRLRFASDRKYLHVFRIKSEAQNGVVFVRDNCNTDEPEKWEIFLNRLKGNSKSREFEFQNVIEDILFLYKELAKLIRNFAKIGHDEIYYELRDDYFEYFNRLEKNLKVIRLNKLYIEDRVAFDRMFNGVEKVIHDIKMVMISDFKKNKENHNLIDEIERIYSITNKLEDLIQDKFKSFELEEDDIGHELENTWFKTPFGYFYNAARLKSERNPLKWNSILRKYGITAIFDDGCGMIHKNEPSQGVVLSGEYIEQLDLIIDPYGKHVQVSPYEKRNIFSEKYQENPESFSDKTILNFVEFCIRNDIVPNIGFIPKHLFLLFRNNIFNKLENSLFETDSMIKLYENDYINYNEFEKYVFSLKDFYELKKVLERSFYRQTKYPENFNKKFLSYCTRIASEHTIVYWIIENQLPLLPKGDIMRLLNSGEVKTIKKLFIGLERLEDDQGYQKLSNEDLIDLIKNSDEKIVKNWALGSLMKRDPDFDVKQLKDYLI